MKDRSYWAHADRMFRKTWLDAASYNWVRLTVGQYKRSPYQKYTVMYMNDTHVVHMLWWANDKNLNLPKQVRKDVMRFFHKGTGCEKALTTYVREVD